jgi:hypothetical protein
MFARLRHNKALGGPFEKQVEKSCFAKIDENPPYIKNVS